MVLRKLKSKKRQGARLSTWVVYANLVAKKNSIVDFGGKVFFPSLTVFELIRYGSVRSSIEKNERPESKQ
jgi:hypothetical protein